MAPASISVSFMAFAGEIGQRVTPLPPPPKKKEKRDVAIRKPRIFENIVHLQRNVWMTKHFYVILTYLNGCISVKKSPINTKLGDFVNVGVLFQTLRLAQLGERRNVFVVVHCNCTTHYTLSPGCKVVSP